MASTLLAAGAALAHPPESDDKAEAEQTAEVETPAEIAPAEAVEIDCETLTDEAEQAKCVEDAARRAAAEANAEAQPKKGGKAQRSNTNRMEADNTDE
jgi:DNA-directed RNA polymerase alpha subunit